MQTDEVHPVEVEQTIESSFSASGFDEQPAADSAARQEVESGKPIVSWSASEYIAHHKSLGWYMALVAASVLISGFVFLVTRDWITFGTILIVALLFGVFASREPNVLTYEIYPSGIVIGNKDYHFDDFKSFAVHSDAPLPSVFFLPIKRFMPGLSIYFPPEQAEQIISTLSNYLPKEDRGPDAVDRLMRRVRF